MDDGPPPRRPAKQQDIGWYFGCLNRDTYLSRRDLRLHKIIKRRHRAGPRRLSRCNCRIPIGLISKKVRSDSRAYHDNKDRPWRGKGEQMPTEFVFDYIGSMCPMIRDRFRIYGTVGFGTFGWVFAARERDAGDDPPRHFAMKAEALVPRHKEIEKLNPSTSVYQEVQRGLPQRCIPTEGIILHHLTESDRFPKIDSIYCHGLYQTTFMSFGSIHKDNHEEWMHRDGLPESWELRPDKSFAAYAGVELLHKKSSQLHHEIQVCKIASHLLQGMVYLLDMRIVHDDLSHRNYLVDECLNAQLIDFGRMGMARDEEDWIVDDWHHIGAYEYLLPPEIAIGLNRTRVFDADRLTYEDQEAIFFPHDIRKQVTWKLGVLIYDLLHGYSPWEPPDYDPEIGEVRDIHFKLTAERLQSLADRRARIINEELPMREDLSQDCIDVLRTLLAKDIRDRQGIIEITSMPWFQGHWADWPLSYFLRPDQVDAPAAQSK